MAAPDGGQSPTKPMSAFILNNFAGERPRVPAHLLESNESQQAINCEFGYGKLRGIKGPARVGSTMSNAVQGMWTDNGIQFFTWPFDVNAVRSPVIGEKFGRVYYTGGGDFRFADGALARVTGGVPSTSYRVGVPKPSTAPTLEADAETEQAAGGITSRFHYELGGVKYQEQDITLTVDDAGKSYHFDAPAKDTGTSTTTAPGGETLTIRSVGHYIDGRYQASQAFNPFTVSLASTSGLTVADPLSSGLPVGYSFTGYDYVEAADGQILAVAMLYTLARYGTLSESNIANGVTNANPGSTPTDAFAVIYMEVRDPDTSALDFKGYSSNSSFAEASQKVKINLAAHQGSQTRYDVTLERNGDSGLSDAKDDVTRAYVYTFVNIYGEEGPPSDPSLITGKLLETIKVTTKVDNPGQYAPFSSMRVYRTQDGTASDNFYYVGEIITGGVLAGTFILPDSLTSGELGEAISTIGYFPPPPTLIGLCQLPNGIMCGIKDSEAWFSEAFKPYAWNPENVVTFPHRCVGVLPTSVGAVVTTTAGAHNVNGVSPDGMVESIVPGSVGQGGAGKLAMCDVAGAIVYASNDGLVVVEGGGATLKYGERFFTREVWRDLVAGDLSFLRFACHDGRLLAWVEASRSLFMIRLDEAAGSYTRLDFQQPWECSFYLPLADGLYIAAGNTVWAWGATDRVACDWTSKEFVLPRPTNFGAIQVVVSWGTAFVTLFAQISGVWRQISSKALSVGTHTYRLPAGFKSTRFKLVMNGELEVLEVRIAETMKELASV
jgi:hypothetical protein